MDKLRKELNAETGRRLKLLYKQTGKSQRVIAKMIGRKETALSAIANGRAPLTERTAKAINGIFPDYSVEYLIGISPYRNDAERELVEAAQRKHDGDLLSLGFGALAEVCGYTLTATLAFEVQGSSPFVFVSQGDTQVPDDFDADEIVEHISSALASSKGNWERVAPAPMMIVAYDGKSVTVPRSEIKALQKEVRDFVDFKLHLMLDQ